MSDLLFEYKVRARHRLGWKEFTFYATTDIEEFLNRNSIDYVRNATDTVENRLFKENKRLNNIINGLEKKLVASILYDNDKKGDMVLEYQEKIDKAIEYINENWGHWCSNHCKYATETINILKGSNKE